MPHGLKKNRDVHFQTICRNIYHPNDHENRAIFACNEFGTRELFFGRPSTLRQTRRFRLVGVAGTFDTFHAGHEALLSTALDVGEKVQIGLSSDNFVERMNKTHEVSSYSERAEAIRLFLEHTKAIKTAEIVPIEDQDGTAKTSTKMEALVVSEETFSEAQELNRKRHELGLPALELVVVKMVLADDGIPISTTRIRGRQITRIGKSLAKKATIAEERDEDIP